MRTSAPIITALVLTGSLTYGGSYLRSQEPAAHPTVTNPLLTHTSVSLEQLDGSNRWPAPAGTTPEGSQNHESADNRCSCAQDHESVFDLLAQADRLPAMVFPDEGVFLD